MQGSALHTYWKITFPLIFKKDDSQETENRESRGNMIYFDNPLPLLGHQSHPCLIVSAI